VRWPRSRSFPLKRNSLDHCTLVRDSSGPPILYPTGMKLGYDPIWFGVMIAITIMIGVIVPPVAICVFIVKNITGTPFGVIYKGVLPFLLGRNACAALLFIFPCLATFLSNYLMGGS